MGRKHMEIKRYGGNGRMSKGVAYNGVLYLCGQTGNPEHDIKMQAAEILQRIEELLTEYGSDKSLLLTAQIFLADIRLFDAFNQVWDGWVVPGCEPARFCVEARAASACKNVEVVVSAALRD